MMGKKGRGGGLWLPGAVLIVGFGSVLASAAR
jgi:hypothetical protein